jgi:hypothetical protein
VVTDVNFFDADPTLLGLSKSMLCLPRVFCRRYRPTGSVIPFDPDMELRRRLQDTAVVGHVIAWIIVTCNAALILNFCSKDTQNFLYFFAIRMLGSGVLSGF